MQVSYVLVFFLEYFGPFMIYPFFWSRNGREWAYGIDSEAVPRLPVQDIACFYWCLHYAKVRCHCAMHGTAADNLTIDRVEKDLR